MNTKQNDHRVHHVFSKEESRNQFVLDVLPVDGLSRSGWQVSDRSSMV